MFVCCECCLLSGRGLSDELITRPEESYRLWCVVMCNLGNLKNEEAMTRVGFQRHSKEKGTWSSECQIRLKHLFICNSPTYTIMANTSGQSILALIDVQ